MTTSAEYWNRAASTKTRYAHQREWINEAVASLKGLDVSSHADLIRALPGIDEQRRIHAIHLFDYLRVRSAGPALVNCFLTGGKEEEFAANNALQSVLNPKAFRMLISVILADTHPDRSEQACYILAHSWEDALTQPLLALYRNENLTVEVRAQAAEGLAYNLSCCDRRKRLFRQATNALIVGLSHPDARMRFWSCFALGSIKARRALPKLACLAAEDEAICPWWWHVKGEAADAICWIHGKESPHRVQMGGGG